MRPRQRKRRSRRTWRRGWSRKPGRPHPGSPLRVCCSSGRLGATATTTTWRDRTGRRPRQFVRAPRRSAGSGRRSARAGSPGPRIGRAVQLVRRRSPAVLWRPAVPDGWCRRARDPSEEGRSRPSRRTGRSELLRFPPRLGRRCRQLTGTRCAVRPRHPRCGRAATERNREDDQGDGPSQLSSPHRIRHPSRSFASMGRTRSTPIIG